MATAVKKEVTEATVRNDVKKQERTIAQKLLAEKKVGVVGLEIYAQYLGTTYTFLLNGIPVSIKLDGTTQFYPKSVAKLLNKKLNAIGSSNTRRVVNVEI